MQWFWHMQIALVSPKDKTSAGSVGAAPSACPWAGVSALPLLLSSQSFQLLSVQADSFGGCGWLVVEAPKGSQRHWAWNPVHLTQGLSPGKWATLLGSVANFGELCL